jgi:DNA-binding NtrC family response regulator
VTTQEIAETLMDPSPLDERLLRIEAAIISTTLAETGGNKSEAARRLGIKRSTLGDRITRCGLRRPEPPQVHSVFQ